MGKRSAVIIKIVGTVIEYQNVRYCEMEKLLDIIVVEYQILASGT